MQIKNLKATIEYLTHHMLNTNESTATSSSARPSSHTQSSEEVNPILIRKHPKFPTRDRHLAIRRKRAVSQNSPADSMRSEILTLPSSPTMSSSSNKSEIEEKGAIESSMEFCCDEK